MCKKTGTKSEHSADVLINPDPSSIFMWIINKVKKLTFFSWLKLLTSVHGMKLNFAL